MKIGHYNRVGRVTIMITSYGLHKYHVPSDILKVTVPVTKLQVAYRYCCILVRRFDYFKNKRSRESILFVRPYRF